MQLEKFFKVSKKDERGEFKEATIHSCYWQ